MNILSQIYYSSFIIQHSSFLDERLRHRSFLRGHAHEIHAVGETADVDAGRILNYVHGVNQCTIDIKHLNARDIDIAVNADINILFRRVRVEGDAVGQVVFNTRGGHGDGLRPSAEVAVTTVGLHLDLIRGVLCQTRDGVAVRSGSGGRDSPSLRAVLDVIAFRIGAGIPRDGNALTCNIACGETRRNISRLTLYIFHDIGKTLVHRGNSRLIKAPHEGSYIHAF